MRVLITGGAGFLGSHLCDRFLTEGHTVLAMDNLITGSMDNIAHLLGHDRFTLLNTILLITFMSRDRLMRFYILRLRQAQLTT